MPQYGTIKRTKPRMTVLRGYNPMETAPGTESAPVASGVTIKSGQVISLVWNAVTLQSEWNLGTPANSGIPHFALQDSADQDVIEAGKLTGYSALGKFRLQTAYYKTGDTYNDAVPVTPDGETGDVKATTLESGAPIVGFVHLNRGPQSLVGVDSSASTLTVITIDTVYLPNSVDDTAS